jgi:vancomycin resistance protein YoaR
LRDLGISVDVDAVTARALRLGRTEDTWTRARLADRAHRGELDVPLEPNVDPNVTVQRLAALKEDLDEPPQSARMDIDHHGVVPEHYGRALDIDAAAVDLARAALDSRVVEIDLVFRSVAPSVTREALAHVDISRVLASFSTYFSRRGDHEPRARNIEVAASHIDGLVIEPGQVVSFNAVVGARSEDNGFAKAYEIFKGEYVEGTGGGTCQVASTLHAVAFFAGLEVVQRLPHSRPSAYIPAGLDATVVFPTVDLKLRNPFSFPVVLHARVGKNDIKMELLGADKPVDVTFDKEVLSTTPFGRKVVEEPGRDKPKRKQKGIDGMQLRRSRWLAFHDGHRRVESSRDTYPPTQEIWQIPPGYDERDLPALGEDLDAKDSGLQAPGSGSDTAGVL